MVNTESGLRWTNVGLGTPWEPGYQHWLPDGPEGVGLHKSVSGSEQRGWRFWHIGYPPGGGEHFWSKRAAFAAAEGWTRRG